MLTLLSRGQSSHLETKARELATKADELRSKAFAVDDNARELESVLPQLKAGSERGHSVRDQAADDYFNQCRDLHAQLDDMQTDTEMRRMAKGGEFGELVNLHGVLSGAVNGLKDHLGPEPFVFRTEAAIMVRWDQLVEEAQKQMKKKATDSDIHLGLLDLRSLEALQSADFILARSYEAKSS